MPERPIPALFNRSVREASLSALQGFIQEVRAMEEDFPLDARDLDDIATRYLTFGGARDERPELVIGVEKLLLEKALRAVLPGELRAAWRDLLNRDFSREVVQAHCAQFGHELMHAMAKRMLGGMGALTQEIERTRSDHAHDIAHNALIGFMARLERIAKWC